MKNIDVVINSSASELAKNKVLEAAGVQAQDVNVQRDANGKVVHIHIPVTDANEAAVTAALANVAGASPTTTSSIVERVVARITGASTDESDNWDQFSIDAAPSTDGDILTMVGTERHHDLVAIKNNTVFSKGTTLIRVRQKGFDSSTVRGLTTQVTSPAPQLKTRTYSARASLSGTTLTMKTLNTTPIVTGTATIDINVFNLYEFSYSDEEIKLSLNGVVVASGQNVTPSIFGGQTNLTFIQLGVGVSNTIELDFLEVLNK